MHHINFFFFSDILFAVSLIFEDLFLINFRQQALFNVLSAYSMYNTEVGYCQGMSEIAALLLMYLNEEVSECCNFFIGVEGFFYFILKSVKKAYFLKELSTILKSLSLYSHNLFVTSKMLHKVNF